MKTASSIALCVLLNASGVSANVIGVYSNPDCSTCPITLESGESATVYVMGTSSSWAGFGVCEFRVVGLPTEWTHDATPSLEAHVSFGDPLGSGAAIAFASGQHGCTLLYSVEIRATTSATDVALEVTKHENPSSPLVTCPNMNEACGACDGIFCVETSPLQINSGENCPLPTESLTWGQVRSLYR